MLTVEVPTPAHSVCAYCLFQYVLFLTERLYTKGNGWESSVQAIAQQEKAYVFKARLLPERYCSNNTGIAYIINIIADRVDACTSSGHHEEVLLSAHRPVCWFCL